MSKDDLETQCMNELFNSDEEEVPYYNHWRPVAIVNQYGSKIRNLTKQEQIEWVKQ